MGLSVNDYFNSISCDNVIEIKTTKRLPDCFCKYFELENVMWEKATESVVYTYRGKYNV